jgi:murein DD-endopeptidase MepM/ murein hydrolase activator NlpD
MLLVRNNFRKRYEWIISIPSIVHGLWGREYSDSRIILEQRGYLKYFSVTARLQRNVVRGLIALALSFLAGFIIMAIFSLYLMAGNARLERSHNEIYEALIGSVSDISESDGKGITREDMVELAHAIHDREREIRGFVASSSISLAAENSSLKARLEASSLSGKAIKVIQGSAAAGGFDSPRETIRNPQSSGELFDEVKKNRALMDVLSALPSAMPLDGFSLSSPFGMRNHPVMGRPKFHMGVDLLPGSSDAVKPAKAGKVVMAHDYQDYGNTVIIRYDRGIETLYAHLASMNVREGQDVDLDTIIGMVGNTGSSTGKHLHFEISVGGYPVDPLKVIETASYVQKNPK